jgi:hypothetical protein
VFGLRYDTETRLAGERIYPGDPVFAGAGDGQAGYLPHITALAISISALAAGNIINLTVNGVAIAPVSWETDAETTVRRLVEELDRHEALRDLGIDAFTVDGSPLSFYVQGPGLALSASGVISGGASQGTVTSAAYTGTKFAGVACRQELSFREGAGFYPPQSPVSVLAHGKIAAQTALSAKPGDLKPAYIIIEGDEAGKFTDAAGGNYECGCLFRSGFLEPGLALIEARGAR